MAGLHLVGIALVLLVVSGGHARRAAGGLSIVGLGVTAYTLGLRHAFDADHISAIDNTTRKFMAEGQRPLSVGFWFSLGHSTVVFALAGLFAVGMRSLGGQVRDSSSLLHSIGGLIGTGVSGAFLYLIAGLNLVVLWGIISVFREARARPLRRDPARGRTRCTRVHEPVLRPLHAGDPSPLADVPGRSALRDGL